MVQRGSAIKIFFCYAREDEKLLEALKRHLSPLQRQNFIDVWHDRNISAGTEWKQEIEKHLNEAHMILLLISPYFIASEYCCGIEMQSALKRHKQRESRVIPIILRPVDDWKKIPPAPFGDIQLGQLQALPTDAKAVTSWRNRDKAWKAVVEGIKEAVNELLRQTPIALSTPSWSPALSAQNPFHQSFPVPSIDENTLVTESVEGLKIFLCYAREDKALLEKFKGHLRVLKRQGFIRLWYDRDIAPGTEWEREIDTHMSEAEIILLLVSSYFIDSDYCYGIEMKRALERHEADEAQVIPILLRPVDWKGTPFENLKALPSDGTPITQWSDRDAAFADVVKGIRAMLESVQNPMRIAFSTQESTEYRLEQQAERFIINNKRRLVNTPPCIVPTYFQNRYVELNLIEDFLQNRMQRLMIVTGRGGIGKTAMVCHLLKSLESGKLLGDDTPFNVDGIVYLSANGWYRINAVNIYADLCSLLPDKTAQRLDRLYKEPRVSTEFKMRALLTEFIAKNIVLLLDNFEDLVSPETRQIRDRELDEVLRALLELPPHGVKVIITSRLTPRKLLLTCPERQRLLQLDEGLSSPYAENILQEMDADGKLGLKNADASVLTRVCRQIRGYPRALEALVAAMRADSYTSLDDLLNITKNQLPENVVYALVGEAFNRLDPFAQKVIQALAIYGRPVSSTAINYLLQRYNPGINCEPVLSRLSVMHFIRCETDLYDLHPVDRAYALDRISKGSHSDHELKVPPFTQLALRHHAADYFKLNRKDKTDWKTIKDLSSPLAELDLRYEGEEYNVAMEVLLEFDYDCLYTWGFYRLVAELHERLQTKTSDKRLKIQSLQRMGGAYANMGQSQPGITCHNQSLIISREIGDRRGEGRALVNLGVCYDDLGQTVHAIDCYEQALLIAQELGDQWCEGVALANLGANYDDLGQVKRAVEYCEQAVLLARKDADPLAEGVALGHLAHALISMGQYVEAIQMAGEGLQIGNKTEGPRFGNYCNGFLALAYLYVGNLATARTAAEDAQKYDEPLNNHFVLMLLGIIILLQGNQRETTEAGNVFWSAVTAAEKLLEYTPHNYKAIDAKFLSFCGLVLCEENMDYIPTAIESYRQARMINQNAGYVKSVIELFTKLIEADLSNFLALVRDSVAGK